MHCDKVTIMIARFLSLFLIFFLLISLPVAAHDPYAEPEEVKPAFAILDVNIQSNEWTEYFPTCDDEDCVPWSFWNRYTAKVNRVLDGEYVDDSIDFVLLQHSQYLYRKGQRAIVIIEKFTNDDTIEKLETAYFANEINFPREMVCLDTGKSDAADNSSFQYNYISTGEATRCFLPDDLDAAED